MAVKEVFKVCCNNKHCISIGLLVLFGILFGVAVALVWFFGFAVFTRAMVPYALALAIVLLATTVIFRAICGNPYRGCRQEFHESPTCCSLSKYSPLVLISSAVCIIGCLIFLAIDWVFTWKAVLAFVDAISFGIMVFGFFAMVFCISFKHE